MDVFRVGSCFSLGSIFTKKSKIGERPMVPVINNYVADASECVLEDCVLCGCFSHYLNDEGICKSCRDSITEEREREL